METAIHLRDIEERLLCGLLLVEAAESCVRALCKPLRSRPLGPTTAKRLWTNMRTLFAGENVSLLPRLIQGARTSRAKTPPKDWVRAMNAVSNRGHADPVIDAIGRAWKAQRDAFENGSVKAVARAFLSRMGHAPQEQFTKEDSLRWAWAIWFECMPVKRCRDEEVLAVIAEKGAYPVMCWNALKKIMGVSGLRPLDPGAPTAVTMVKNTCIAFKKEHRAILIPTVMEIQEVAITIVRENQPGHEELKDPEVLKIRLRDKRITLSPRIEEGGLQWEIREHMPEADGDNGRIAAALDKAVAMGALCREVLGAKIYYFSPSSSKQDVPRWDADDRKLWFRGKVCKAFKKHPAPNQVLLLNRFEECGWPHRIDDPLLRSPTIVPARKLADTVKHLSKKMGCPLRFRMDGTGEGVQWSVTED